MDRYKPLEIEAKWQAKWEKDKPFKATEKPGNKKMYLAEMFPYPSGAGLHVGHVRNFTIVDVLTRFYSQQGFNVLRPFGYDTFGLPAENYAIKTGTAPQKVTLDNIANFRTQAKRLGYAIDWDREINTSSPEYYKWTQWCFLQLFKKGLAYQKESYQWFCPVDQTVLANEQVENGHCWRCGAEVEKKKMKQWFFKITDYADELLDDIDNLDWPEKIKTMQKNWIGRSEGALVTFNVTGDAKCSSDGSKVVAESTGYSSVGHKLVTGDAKCSSDDHRLGRTALSVSEEERLRQDPSQGITVFTTRPDTIFAATFLVLAPEHPLLKTLTTDDARPAVEAYCASAMKKSEIERQENKEKTGVFTGAYAVNPMNGNKLPIWVADYVLMGYGTGAIMAVPGGDERDAEFAEKFNLPIVKITKTAKIEDIENQGCGKRHTTYKMRDWLISRQRYWGCPIPIAYDKNGEPHAIPEDQLPVTLPEVSDYQPDNSGRSALAKAKDWLKVTIDGEEMTRETDTLDGYACSSWYLWRYTSPHDDAHAWDPETVKYWAPTDIYVGADHAVAHLLYVRFWCKFFADEGYLPFREPIKKLIYHGYINAPDGKKMSKSKGNVIDPLDVIDDGYGADTLRTYEMFIGPYEQDASWDPRSVGGVYRFLNRCWTLCFNGSNDNDANTLSSAHSRPFGQAYGLRKSISRLSTLRNKTIKKVTEDLKRCSFNTAVATLMEYVNELYKEGAEKEDLVTLAKLLKPFAPHLASEMLEKLGADDTWPLWDESALVEENVEFIVTVNGKLRAKLQIPAEIATNEQKVLAMALENENVQKFVPGAPKKTIFVPKSHILNLVV